MRLAQQDDFVFAVDTVSSPRRILVYGVTGSGKSTIAARLAEVLDLPWYSVDDLTWEPGWVAVPFDEQRRRIQQICEQPSWILDTAYGAWLDVPLGSVDLIVALDYPRWLSLSRLVRRTITRVLSREVMCNGNVETWRSMIAADSILRWHFASFRRKRDRIRSWVADPQAPPVKRLATARGTDAWLSTLAGNG